MDKENIEKIIDNIESGGFYEALKECYGDIINALINRAELSCYNKKLLTISDEAFTAILTVFNPSKINNKINELNQKSEVTDDDG